MVGSRLYTRPSSAPARQGHDRSKDGAQRVDGLHVHPHQLRSLPLLEGGAESLPDLGILNQAVEQEDCRRGGEDDKEPGGRHRRAEDKDRVAGEGVFDAPGRRPPQILGDVRQKDGQPDGHKAVYRGVVPHVAKDEAVEKIPHQRAAQQGQNQPHIEGQTQHVDEGVGQICAQHIQLAVGEVGHPHQAEDDGVPHGDQRVAGAQYNTV